MATLEESLVDAVNVAPAIPAVMQFNQSLVDAVNVAPAIPAAMQFNPSIVGAVSIDPVVIEGFLYARDAASILTVADGLSVQAFFTASVQELALAFEGYTPKFQIGLSAADGFTVDHAVVATYAVRLFENVRAGAALAAAASFGLLLADAVRIADQQRTGVSLTLVEQVTLSSAVETLYALSLIEQLGLSDAVIGNATYQRSAVDVIRIVDAFRRFVGGEVAELLDLSETLVTKALRPALAVDQVDLSDAPAPSIVVRVDLSDGVDITSADVLRMIYNDEVAEGVALTAAFLSAGDSFTTWALNTRTAAITEYQNYAFNSFAQLGGRYIGASDQGLYELTGDDDVGEQIIASLKTGIAQLGGSRYTSFRAAYLGIRGAGEYVLKLDTGDGKSYTYSVTANDMETTKINLGKGLRARYFSFELISAGQDFDLDSLEFVPIVAQRRV